MISEDLADFDRKLKKTLAAAAKPQLAPTLRHSLTARLKDLANEAGVFGLADAVAEVSKFFLSRERLLELRQPVPFPTQRAMELGRTGLSATLEFAVNDSPEAFAALPADTLIRQIHSPTLLTKVSRKRKGLLNEVLAIVQREPSIAVHFLGLPWVISKAKIRDLLPLLPFLFDERDEDSDTDRIITLRRHFLRRDKAGRGLIVILRRISDGELSDRGLVDSLQRSPEAATAFVQLLPKLMSNHSAQQAASVFQKWLVSLPDVPKRKRAIISGALAALCGAILLKERRRPVEEWVLSLVTDSIRKLSIEIGANVDGYWGLFPLDVSRGANDGVYISPEGARLLVESLEKLEDDRYAPVDVFKALASNLGLSQVDEPGMVVTYDPKKHQDAMGGLLRDQTAVVIRPGWRYNDTLLLKTKVKQQIDYA